MYRSDQQLALLGMPALPDGAAPGVPVEVGPFFTIDGVPGAAQPVRDVPLAVEFGDVLLPPVVALLPTPLLLPLVPFNPLPPLMLVPLRPLLPVMPLLLGAPSVALLPVVPLPPDGIEVPPMPLPAGLVLVLP
jgi:signal-induced proliferation-associated 1 like protein 3